MKGDEVTKETRMKTTKDNEVESYGIKCSDSKTCREKKERSETEEVTRSKTMREGKS